MALIGDGNVIFNPYANPFPPFVNLGLTLGNSQAIADVEPWLHGEHEARF
jgi:hypothetical protein